MKDPLTWFAEFAAAKLGDAAGLIVFLAFPLALFAWVETKAAVKEDGEDRRNLIRYLREGGTWRIRYLGLLVPWMNRVDRFLGDPERSTPICRRANGGQNHPAWTAASFDRCALLAVIYPLLSMYLVWVGTGESDDIGKFLDLRDDVGIGLRALGLVSIGVSVCVWYRFMKAEGRAQLYWLLVVVCAFAFAFAFAFAVAVAGAGAVAVTVAVAGAFAFAFAFAVAGAVAVAGAGAVAFAGAVAGAVAFAGAGAVAFAFAGAVIYWAERASQAGKLARFWLWLWPGAVLYGYAVIALLAWAEAPPIATTLLTMFLLVPLFNLPLDWLSVGFTRALLRRGAVPDSASHLPFTLGLLDFAIGLVLLTVLAVVLVLGLQVVDGVTLALAGRAIIDVPAHLLRIYASPTDYEHWWIYITLFSTLAPSALNLTLGTVSLTTISFRARREVLIAKITGLQDKGHDATRFYIATEITIQTFCGAVLAGVLLWGVVLMLSWFGTYFLHFLLMIAAIASEVPPIPR